MSRDGSDLARAVSDVLDGVALSELGGSAKELSVRYRAGAGDVVRSDADALAYVATRVPATAGAARMAMESVAELMPAFSPATQLDLGAGPGAAAWAAASVWPDIGSVVLHDVDERMMAIGKQLSEGAFTTWTWQRADMRRPFGVTAELVTIAYALGELEARMALDVARRAWEATTGCLVLVEPGTPSGFALIRDLRHHLIDSGAHLVAPCPNAGPCPVAGDDWCHFAARISRSALHRRLKDGERSFEDEKFSYVAFTRQPSVVRAAGRIVRRPLHRRRFVEVSVCRDGRIERLGLGQSDPEYALVSKLGWGAAMPPGV